MGKIAVRGFARSSRRDDELSPRRKASIIATAAIFAWLVLIVAGIGLVELFGVLF